MTLLFCLDFLVTLITVFVGSDSSDSMSSMLNTELNYRAEPVSEMIISEMIVSVFNKFQLLGRKLLHIWYGTGVFFSTLKKPAIN